jgi:hypothetical protein
MTELSDLATIDFLTHSKIRIAADPSTIWPHIIDLDAWRRGQVLVPIGGEKGRLGERFSASSPDVLDVALFYVENVELIPETRRTIRLEGLDGSFMGFATWELTPLGGQTVVAYDVYTRGPMLQAGQSEKELLTEAQQIMDKGLSRLKAFIERGDADALPV